MYFVQCCSCQNGSLWLQNAATLKGSWIGGISSLSSRRSFLKSFSLNSFHLVSEYNWTNQRPLKKGAELQPGLVVTENGCVNVTEGLNSHLHFFRLPF